MALSHKTKLFVDQTLGVAVARALRLAARGLTKVLRRDHRVPDAPACVAIGKIVGLGSVMQSATLCRGLKARWPATRLVYVTSRSNAELVRRMPAVDEVIEIDDGAVGALLLSSLRVVLALWRRRPAVYFDLEVYSSFSAVIATASLATNRYGFYRRSADFKRFLHTHMVFFNTRRHIEEVYGQLLAAVGGVSPPGGRGAVHVKDVDRVACEAALATLGCTTEPVVIINVNASDLMRERRWPRDRWITFVAQAAQRYPGHVFVLIGSGEERDYVEGVISGLPAQARSRARNAAGTMSIGALLALLERAIMLVTSDTGPLHLAVACGCPTVSLWGPGVPDHYQPTSGRHEVIYTQTYCSPCLYHADFPPCQGDNICMQYTTVDTVLMATERLMVRLAGGLAPDGAAVADVHVWHQDLRHVSPAIFYSPQ